MYTCAIARETHLIILAFAVTFSIAKVFLTHTHEGLVATATTRVFLREGMVVHGGGRGGSNGYCGDDGRGDLGRREGR